MVSPDHIGLTERIHNLLAIGLGKEQKYRSWNLTISNQEKHGDNYLGNFFLGPLS